MTGPKRSNRANALRSTGPRTPEGKAASARNALKHGILSKAVIPPALEGFFVLWWRKTPVHNM
jgi:hypothetical protein